MKNFFKLLMLALPIMLFTSCSDDDDVDYPNGESNFTGTTTTYDLMSVSDPSISGSVTFYQNKDNSTYVKINLQGTPDGGMHPAHIHFNSAAEGGDIAVSLEPVDGNTGFSETEVSALDNGTAITYEELISFDGYINVHASADDLNTLVAQGDIGENILTGQSKSYDLATKDVDGISGSILFEQRVSGDALATIMLDGTPDGGMHPAHIHMNSAAEGGDIAVSFNPVNGTTGMSMTNISALDDGTEITYGQILNYDGYVNVHLSADELGTIVAQGDIGQNELTGESKSYALETRDVDGISGSVLFEERKSGEALATIMLDGTPDGGMHPAHIHMNTAAEGGDIAFTFNPVNGTTGMSMTHVGMLDDETSFGYDDVLGYDGYVNVHLSADDLGTIVAQGDIGQNELTGESKSYELEERAVDGISGSVLFEERVNGEALATIMLDGTPDGGMHPAHIHMNTAAEGGAIAFTFNPVNGTTGMSRTNLAMLDDDTAFGYEDVLTYDGYVNVHLSADDLGTIVAQGDIGQNELTGNSKVYDLDTKDVAGISGYVLFEERNNGEALATIKLNGTPDGGMHPAHIHMGSVAEAPGDIAFTFNPVNGTTGMSRTNVTMLDDAAEDDPMFGYEDVLTYDGYVNVHLSAEDLATIVAQGNIGSNE
ncbi:superoxide dismutase family protein [Gramella lutea]|uniref:Superoxide dismutase family protein n=1 Tax=Christiangramia lutea TaxID=1607951 RepID=A0A9X1V581_9FLAO|nr:superoxide dismutase family protein [Christiangramia lutea]MCH4822923.1 superoxide dismutase family protein [Christiangramia lutea]